MKVLQTIIDEVVHESVNRAWLDGHDDEKSVRQIVHEVAAEAPAWADRIPIEDVIERVLAELSERTLS